MTATASASWDIPGVGPVPEALRDAIAGLMAAQGGLGAISLLCAPKAVADDPAKLLIRGRDGRPAAVLKLAAQAAPALVARETENARLARQLLGPQLGRVVLEPLLAGEADGRSYCVLPYCRPTSSHRLLWAAQRLWLRRFPLRWLRGVVLATQAAPNQVEVDRDFREPLRFMARCQHFASEIRAEASRALARLDDGTWRPRYVLAHNDLFKDNILLRRTSPDESPGGRAFARIAIIDWGGARLRGHAIYDLVRLGESLRFSRGQWRKELHFHSQALDTDLPGARAYLFASLGALGMRREQFPFDRYARCVESCCRLLLEPDQI